MSNFQKNEFFDRLIFCAIIDCLKARFRHTHKLRTSSSINRLTCFFLVTLAFQLQTHSELALSSDNAQISLSPISRKINQPTITTLFKDRFGILWIGTQHGLYRFDGANTRTFSSSQSNEDWIPVSDISGIVEDASGRIIISTFGGGLMIWNEQSRSFQKMSLKSGSEVLYITQLARSSDGEIWTIAKEGLFFYDSRSAFESTSLVQYALVDDLKEISSLKIDKNGNKYFSSGSDIYKISNITNSMEKIFSGDGMQQIGRIKALCLDKQDYLYAGTDTGKVFSVNLIDDSLVSSRRLLTNTSISVITMLFNDNNLWIGTNFGLFKTNGLLSNIDIYNHNNSELSNSHILALLEDEKFIWIGTYHGLSTLSFVPFETFNFENSNVFNDILAFDQDSLGRIWVGTFNGLYFFDPESNRHIQYEGLSGEELAKDRRIMTLASRGDELWIGHQKDGVEILNTKKLSATKLDFTKTSQLEVTKILHSGEKSTWVATFNRGLYRIENGSATSYLKNGSLPEASIIILAELKDGTIVASSEQRVYEYQRSKDRFFSLPFQFGDTFEQPMILCISQSDNRDVWIGTKDHGVFIWPAQYQASRDFTLVKFDADSRFSSSTVYAIEFDDNGSAWISTQSGIVKIEAQNSVVSRFNEANGLQGNDFNFGASYKDSLGRIYFGGSNGYNRFIPLEIQTNDTIPDLLVTKISLSQGRNLGYPEVINLKKIQLNYGDYFVQFEFSVLDFLDPEKNQYRYMLEGFDNQWIENGNRNSATYTNLPPGDYVFRVQGANSSGVWNREGLSLGLEVLPPPWRTWWAYTGYALTLVFLGWVGKRAYDARSVEKRARELAIGWHEAEERADDEMQEQLEIHDDLVKSLYRHSVSTLNLVSEFIAAKNEHLNDISAREAVDSSIRLVEALVLLEDCLYYQNEKLLADFNKYTDIIVSKLLESSPIPSETITTINEVTPQPLPIEQASPLAIALYELVENAIQHAFDSNSFANYIHIVLAKELPDQPGAQYVLIVKDNGLGIPSIIDPLSTQTSGLTIVKSMVWKLAGALEFSTAHGTRVAISFPIAE